MRRCSGIPRKVRPKRLQRFCSNRLPHSTVTFFRFLLRNDLTFWKPVLVIAQVVVAFYRVLVAEFGVWITTVSSPVEVTWRCYLDRWRNVCVLNTKPDNQNPMIIWRPYHLIYIKNGLSSFGFRLFIGPLWSPRNTLIIPRPKVEVLDWWGTKLPTWGTELVTVCSGMLCDLIFNTTPWLITFSNTALTWSHRIHLKMYQERAWKSNSMGAKRVLVHPNI